VGGGGGDGGESGEGPGADAGASTIAVSFATPPRGGDRPNCEFIDLRSPAVGPAAAEYIAALKAGGDYPSGESGGRANGDRSMDGFWVPVVREMAPRLGLFGLVSLAFETLKSVPHVVLHVMGIGAAEHAASEECRKAGGGATDL
jgi:hypothetical protein